MYKTSLSLDFFISPDDADQTRNVIQASTASHSEGLELGPTRCDSNNLKALLRSMSWRLLPIFFLLNCLNYLDRTNLAFASIQMSHDLDLTPKEYGNGAGMFFIGYAIFQIPSQLILRQVGAPMWLSIIVTVWGAVACSMAGIKDESSFYLVRLILGVAESGSFPGYWYYLTKFYPDKHITIPYSITDSAIMCAQVLGAPLAAALLHLDGVWGLRGWQWLFIVEGIPTAFLGLALYFILPASPIAMTWTRPSEAQAIEREVQTCRGTQSLSSSSSWTLLKHALRNKSMYHMGLIKFAKDMTTYGVMFWAPSLIKELRHRHSHTDATTCDSWEHGRESTETGYVEVLLTGIPYSIAAIMNLAVAWNSQRTKDRRWHIAICYGAGGLVCALLPIMNKINVASGFICLTLVIVLSLCPNGCLLALASSAGQGEALPLNLAVFNSIGNLSGAFGASLVGYVAQQTCSYDLAFVILGVVLLLGGVLALFVQDRGTTAVHQQHESGRVTSFVELACPSTDTFSPRLEVHMEADEL